MASQKEIDEIIEKIFQDICQIYKDVEFDTKDMHDCLIRLMEIVETMPTLIGADKKKIVIGVLYLIIHHLRIKDIEREKIQYMLSHDIIDMIIDLIVKLTKFPSRINLKQAAQVVLENNQNVENKIPDVNKNIQTSGYKFNYCILM